uniref:Uncharacterized protein n=1 Tax=viral metagenome TaxID=1070528 RepID=A0A6M3L5Z6_9ZZZZ
MSRAFEHFPDTATCPVCGSNEDGECVLIPIDGTTSGDGRTCEAQPTHLECLDSDRMRYNRKVNVVYVLSSERKKGSPR